MPAARPNDSHKLKGRIKKGKEGKISGKEVQLSQPNHPN